MTDSARLDALIADQGRSKKWLADKLGISYNSLWQKINNHREFTFEEIKALCNILGISSLEEREEIFFNLDVDKLPTHGGTDD